jgi:hypothetical protein
MALTTEEQAFDISPKDGKLSEAERANFDKSQVPLGTAGGPTSGTSVNTAATRLNYQSAKELLEKSIEGLEVNLKFTKEDILAFMEIFKKEQDKQIAKTVVTSSSKTTPGAGENAVANTVESTQKNEYPSFFNPTQTAQDFIWSKINFKDEAVLGGKTLGILSDVRAAVEAFQLMGVSDADARVAAKQIAMGKKTLDSYKTELQAKAKKEYPQFADRFDADPELTTFDIASPIIGMLSKTWEVDSDSIKMDNPIVMSYMNYAGADGKGKQPSRYDLLLKAKQDPKYQLTQQANEDARSAATELARAFGFGI